MNRALLGCLLSIAAAPMKYFLNVIRLRNKMKQIVSQFDSNNNNNNNNNNEHLIRAKNNNNK